MCETPKTDQTGTGFIHKPARRSHYCSSGLALTLSRCQNSAASTSHLEHGLPVGVDLHDGLGPLHHGVSSRDLDSLVFEATHPELSGVVPPHRRGRPRALHGRLPPVLQPHYGPADTSGSEVTGLKLKAQDQRLLCITDSLCGAGINK